MASTTTNSHFSAPNNSGAFIGNNSGIINNYFSGRNDAANQSEVASLIFLTDPAINRLNVQVEKGDRAPSTCEWILEDHRFLEWKESTSSSLWITGGPGKGKTMLALHITEVLIQNLDMKDTTLLFFFCSHQDKTRNEATAVLRGLMYQLLRQHPNLEYYAAESLTKQNIAHTLSSFGSLWDILAKMLCDPEVKNVFCVIDALNECDDESRLLLTRKFFQFVSTVKSSKEIQFKLLGLSRTISQVDFKPDHNVLMDTDKLLYTIDDIRRFVEHSLKRLERIRGFEKIREEVHQTLVDRAEGSFLWIGLLVSQMARKKTATAILSILNETPDGLDALYESILGRVDESSTHTLSRILSWLAVSYRPLTVTELADALGYVPQRGLDPSDILYDQLDECADFFMIVPEDKFCYVNAKPIADRYTYLKDNSQENVHVIFHQGVTKEQQNNRALGHNGKTFFVHRPRSSVSTSDKIVFFAHHSMKEYLVREVLESDPIRSIYRVNEAQAHLEIAERALEYMSNSILREKYVAFHEVSTQSEAPFLLYASLYWTMHATETPQAGQEMPEMDHEFVDDIKGSQVRLNWLLSYLLEVSEQDFGLELSRDRKGFSLFSIACWFGIPSWISPLLERQKQGEDRQSLLDSPDEGKQSPLTYAIQKKNRNGIAHRLLQLGATPTGEEICVALRYEGEPLFLDLIEHADLNALDSSGFTPLMHAAVGRYKGAVRLLLQAGASVDVRAQNSFSALDAAMPEPSILKILLEHGAQEFTIAAAATRAFGSFMFDLDGSVLTLLKYVPSWIPRMTAAGILRKCAEGGYTESIKFLLHHNADVNLICGNKMPAIYYALAAGRPNIVSLLRSSGAALQYFSQNGPRALARAAKKNRIEGARSLLSEGVSPLCLLPSGRTPLFFAARRGHMGMIRLLVTSGADLNIKDNNGRTALMNAAYKGHRDIVKMLLETGAIIDVQDLEGRTALHFAGIEGYKSTMRAIANEMGNLVKGGGAPMRDKFGKTAWQYLGEHGPAPKFGGRTLIHMD